MNQNICNICGANYEYHNGRWKCPACGAYKAEEFSNEENSLLYSAAQKLRLSDFSEAEEEYSDIIEKYPHNANAYWGRLLAKYGIKYEQDYDGRRIPTCYATSIDSIIDSIDYKKACELADIDTRQYFEDQANHLEQIRCEWVRKASKEKAYDIFICYKDSDFECGIERTKDSIVAQEIYIHLIEQGYRVFFSRESLRDKIGEKYEPYIFNALSTSKVMLVYGSSANYITSTWLKNEWHRFYKKILNGDKHPESLIVACDGFSPAELPTTLSSRQCLNATRKTFFSDLDRCIRKIIQECPSVPSTNSTKETPHFPGLHEHAYKISVIQPTCIAKGYTIHRCNCGYEYKDTYTDLVAHKLKVIERIDPTCNVTGHEKKTCEICGESVTITLPALNHQFTKWIENKHPTCTENGESQRQCTRCGHTEIQITAKSGHRFSSWITNEDGTQSSYCVNCGQTKTIEKTSSEKNITIGFIDILCNFKLYWKSFFTNETTRKQKFTHWLGCSLTLVSMLMFGVSIILSYTDGIVGNSINISILWVLLFLVNAILLIYASISSYRESRYYLKQGRTLQIPVKSRHGVRIISRVLLFLTTISVATMFADNATDRMTGLIMSFIFSVWTVVSAIYIHCPKEYKKIQFTSKATPVSKFNLIWIGIISTFAAIVVLGLY